MKERNYDKLMIIKEQNKYKKNYFLQTLIIKLNYYNIYNYRKMLKNTYKILSPD